MAASAPRTVPTAIDPADCIAALADPVQRADAEVIAALMTRLSGEPARMWGPSIIGFGRYRYRYDSGREGEMCRIGFAPRKGQMVLYLLDGHAGHAAELARLGRHKTGKSCLYVRRLADVDLAVLETLLADSLAWMAEKYPPDAA
jgi:hypothetical protein